ncbi:MAG TPA: MFS transporter [Verrucomicrobiae bacterium]
MLQTTAQTPETRPEVKSLRDVSPRQWKSGIAAWLGWLFDGLDMHLYTLVAASFVALLLNVQPGDPEQKTYSAWIQAAFLVGWALGGGFFGRIGDKLGRSRALSLTILTYAIFTGLSFFVQNWWQLMICRFVAALGIGGEWAVGASLLSETWPKKWRPWIAAVLQTGVNIGVLLACVAVAGLAAIPGYQERWVFLVGVLPAFMVFWIRRHVPEPEEWHAAKNATGEREPSVLDLFRGALLKRTLLIIGICSLSLSGWWAFMFWHTQHLRGLPELANWTPGEKVQLASALFFCVIGVSSVGNFFAGFLAKKLGYRRAIALMCVGFGVAIFGSYAVVRTYKELFFWLPLVGFFSGVFGLFTMYLPPLFPTLLRTTGAGFCYNIGRIAAAFGTVFFGLYSNVTDLRQTLLMVSFLFIPAAMVAMFLPELSPEEGGTN